jgi:hypothetical protein
MQKDLVAVTVKGVMPTPNGCAVFLGNEAKTFVIYVDQFVGNAIQMTLNGVKKDRPLTHDLIGSILLGLGARSTTSSSTTPRGHLLRADLPAHGERAREEDRRDRRAPERLHRARPPAEAPDLRRPGRLRRPSRT